MNRKAAQKIADAVLYEGYMLYPYRPSALKNRQRWSFGTLYPPAYEEVVRGTESNRMHPEILVAGDERTTVHVRLRFLHLLPSNEGEARDFEFEYANVIGPPLVIPFSFEADAKREMPRDEHSETAAGAGRGSPQVNGTVSCSGERVSDRLVKLTIDVINETPFSTDPADRNSALLRSMLSAHLILSVGCGEFISLLEPPDDAGDFVRGCRNVGNFPVLLGEPGSHDMMLCSPILLYDYPQVAPESAGDFFDGTEMDEMLTLRLITLTDDEKNEVRSADERVRTLLQRTEETAREQLMRTHGTIRSMRPSGGER